MNNLQEAFKQNKNQLGLGLRPVHVPYILKNKPKVDYFEIISENFMGMQGKSHKNLEAILKDYAVVLHGVSMNLGSTDPLDMKYLKSLKELADFVDAPFLSDHLCWTGVDGENLHDLLPLPHNEKTIKYLAKKIEIVQDVLERPFGIENLSSYALVPNSDLSEAEFYTGVISESNCMAMLDINNIYVSSQNHKFNPIDYLKKIEWSKVLQCHIAGHSEETNGVIIDTHDTPVCDEVWELYKEAWKISGGFNTLLEWDSKIPEFKVVLEELNKSKAFQGDF